MTNGSDRKRSQVVPIVVAALVCDVAVQDPTTKKANLIGVFDRVHVRDFPSQRPMHLFIRLLDADGFYEVVIRFVRVATGEILAEAKGQLDSKSPLDSSTSLIGFPPLLLPAAGRYEFQIWANDMFLGSTPLMVVPQKDS